MEWWEQPYLTGPAVDVRGFPRPLYPPDAVLKGKPDSVDGPDVLAYKRAICHAGRWGDWDPNLWDDSYSNSFAHGRLDGTGNVKDTGIAGFQRQSDIDDTGWLGHKTFQVMRLARISDPYAPHYGEPILDSVCVDLINDAWDLFGGSEPPPPEQGTLRQHALDFARHEIGVKESPPNSNQVKFCSWYGMLGPWCAMFVTWCYEQAGETDAFQVGERYAYVPYVVADARARKRGLRTTDDPIPGDLVCYDWNGNGEYDHMGIFETWTQSTTQFNAIEGNTSTSNNSNGGQVMRRSRNRASQATVFVRVA